MVFNHSTGFDYFVGFPCFISGKLKEEKNLLDFHKKGCFYDYILRFNNVKYRYRERWPTRGKLHQSESKG
ncbi:hypothetical protein GCM10011391_15890 [Pullulanibacillus camelliae]|uniref:Uncharacterized protein n=1 Tax=Pullulanibacillus camelliae TaxID=1707096 RepID=A0A8J2VUC9_9BACL|nr:hypothetical protein GCM10011391_15890 [Pullulanibacillus camelliae]